MAVYCEKRTDEELLRDIKEAGRVLLVGCPICPNFSCAANQQVDGPVSRAGLKGVRPLLLAAEMDRTADLMRDKGVAADCWTLPGLPPVTFCSTNDVAPEKLVDRAHGGPSFAAHSSNPGLRIHRTIAVVVNNTRR